MTQPTKMTLFRPAYMDCRVTLTPTELRDAAANIDEYLTKKLRKQLEEKCCVHGYVRRGSTQILARSMGQAEHCRFTGDFLFVCKVRVLCFLPESGQMVDAQVLKVNKGGAYALVVEGGRVSEAVRIFVPRDFHIGNTEFDELMEEQVIRVKLMRSRFQANDPFIQAVGTFEGMSTVEVSVPARKGILEPAVGMTPAAEAEEGGAVYNVKEEPGGGFTITRREKDAPAPAPVPAPIPPSSDFGAVLAEAQKAAEAKGPSIAAAEESSESGNSFSTTESETGSDTNSNTGSDTNSNTGSDTNSNTNSNTDSNTNSSSATSDESKASKKSTGSMTGAAGLFGNA